MYRGWLKQQIAAAKAEVRKWPVWMTPNKTITKEEFLAKLPAIREAAKKCGYAVGLHGSLERDFDLIAVAWVEDAKNPVELSEAVFAAAGATKMRFNSDPGKPHGRLNTAFDWGSYENREYCDLSIIPPREN